MKPSKKPGSLRYTAIGAVIVAITAGVLGYMQHVQIARDINAVSEHNNVLLARIFANLVWPDIRDFVKSAHKLPADALRSHPKIAETRARAADLAKDVPLLKLKIFDLNGLTVFSTDGAQIGESNRAVQGFDAARQGTITSALTDRKTFDAFGTTVYNRRVMSSYIALSGENNEIEGVLEIYTDVTEPLNRARNAGMLRIAVVGLLFLLLYEIGAGLLWHRDKTIAEAHAEQLRLTELAVAAEESSRSKSTLLANMSHELRTPLNAVIGFAETIRLQPFGPIGSPKYFTYVDDILSSGHRVLAIVDNVLEMARIDSGAARLRLNGITVAELIDGAVRQVESIAAGEAAPIRVHGPFSSLTVFVDEKRMRQVLVHLLSNARKFTPPLGSIEIAARRNRSGDLEIAVTDTGIGMTPEAIDVALIPFNRTETPYEFTSDGARLGLPLVKMLMTLHGGTITIDSVLGKGTSVTVTLPSRSIVTDESPRLRTSYPA